MIYNTSHKDDFFQFDANYSRVGAYPAIDGRISLIEDCAEDLKFDFHFSVIRNHQPSEGDFRAFSKMFVVNYQALRSEVEHDLYAMALPRLMKEARFIEARLNRLADPDYYLDTLKDAVAGNRGNVEEALFLLPDASNTDLLNKAIALVIESASSLAQNSERGMSGSESKDPLKALPNGVANILNMMIYRHPYYLEVTDQKDASIFETYHALKAQKVI